MKEETFISVDIETSGPIPGEYSMLSIGACLVADETITFESFIYPTTNNYDPEAIRATGITLTDARIKGVSPENAMSLFYDWVQCIAKDTTPVFVGFNSPFDWSFVNYYLHKYLGKNPFGFTALDIKSMYFGKIGSTWNETRSSAISKHVGIPQVGGHNALQDAKYQAKLFQSILNL